MEPSPTSYAEAHLPQQFGRIREPAQRPRRGGGAASLLPPAPPRRCTPVPGPRSLWPAPVTPPGTGSPRLRPALVNAGAGVKSRQVSCAMFGFQVCTAKSI